MYDPTDPNSTKCCCCIKLKVGIILIGIWFIVESLVGGFYIATEEVLESTLYGITTLSVIVLAVHFIVIMVKKDSLKVRDSWVTAMLIDMALNFLLAALRVYMLFNTDRVEEGCVKYYGYKVIEDNEENVNACMVKTQK